MVDYTVFYVLGAIILSLGLVFGVSYLRTKKIVNTDDLKIVSNLLSLSTIIIQEMGLVHEPEIVKISNIIVLSLENTIGIVKLKDKEKIIEQSKIFTYQLCEKNNIELTDSRKEIINQLIQMVLNTKYSDIIIN